MIRLKYDPGGLLAVAQSAIGMTFDSNLSPSTDVRSNVAVIDVRGPLFHHATWCFDSYDAIKARVGVALTSKPKAILLSIDSPGGDVSGCLDTATEIRAMCERAETPLYAYVDGHATSAAYALACVANKIFIPSTGVVGSIGVISALSDVTAANAAMGLNVRVVTSGARKGDSNPNVPISDDAVAALQTQVSALAETFFEHVATYRPLSAENVRALEAGLVTGADALGTRLADAIATFDEVLALVTTEGTETQMSTKSYDDTVASLRKMAEGDDKDEAANAKRMLAALNAEDGDKDDEKKSDAKTEDDAPEKKKDEEESDSKDAKAIAARALAMVEADRKDRAAAQMIAERSALFATRPDITPELRASLESAPIATVKSVLDATPVRKFTNKAGAVFAAAGTRGAETDTSAPRQTAEGSQSMRLAMGMDKPKLGVVHEGDTLVLGALVSGNAAKAGV